MEIKLYQNDLPDGLDLGRAVAVDSETLGLNLRRDRLCLVQLSSGDGVCHLVQRRDAAAPAPNLQALLNDPETLKILHYARFDMAVFLHYLGVTTAPVYCTKIASKLVRTFTDRHGLKDLTRDLLGVEISKQQQSSDWGAEELSEAQQRYAATDVLHLHEMKKILDEMLARERRTALADACFSFLPARAALDLAGWADEDIFAH